MPCRLDELLDDRSRRRPHRDHTIDGGEDGLRHLAWMHGDEEHALDGAGNPGRSAAPRFRHEMMRLVGDDPVRPAGFHAQFLQPRERSREELGPLVQRNAEQVHHDALCRCLQHVQHLGDRRRPLGVPQHHGARKRHVVALGIQQTILVAALGESLE